MKILYILIFIVGCVYFLGAPYLFYIGKLSASELISILAVVPLSLLAIFQEQLKRWFFAPKLQVIFSLDSPFCSKTPFGFIEEVPMDDGRIHKIMPHPTEAYYFRFGVINTGKSQAKLCEAFIAELQELRDGKWIDVEHFQQVNLKWDSGRLEDPYININPSPIKRLVIIGHIYKHRSGLDFGHAIKFHFDFPYLIGGYQPQFLSPNRRYRFNITVVAENADSKSQKFELYWTGGWKDDPEGMFKKISIKLL